ncbi:MAG TPA: ABC transporter ATP-binding protein [Acidimicrobiales bacterium]|jgi:branched-chain amino acid transport system ATP-binding protein
MALLDVDAISVFYGPVQALRGVSISVAEGEMVALVGANGAGKTTTLRTISGMLEPRTGAVLLDGTPISGQPSYKVLEHGLAHVPEGRELFAGMSVEENLRLGFYSKRKAKDFERRADEVMGYFPILGERAAQAAGTLSGGEQQMLVMARALMSEPRVLLVDELSLGLAPMIVKQLFDILRTVNTTRGTAVLLVEQFVHMALGNTHRAYVLQKGEVVSEARSADLLADESLIASYLGEAATAGGP